ncbi:hypothetical protein HLB44_06240 [Aquincola sp. S2]|uniref:Uncharacterized protein n=1 Tax=Pseudaquabacterium terrae TaxID=2732868 RepID=A0ABX2EBQ2_9BURK|nr:hypothetical protein [Aquabacterium terrae]NRF66576.1 hypothetical protein [Aquabacterium terrae]
MPEPTAVAAREVPPPAATELARDAQAQLALTELFPHLRSAADLELRDLFVSLRLAPHARAG